MCGTALLNIAQANKKDEFYTCLSDIEAELKYYKSYFKGKTVYCNCDDSAVSNFTKFFVQHFEEYGLRRLISTCYKPNQTDLFTQRSNTPATYISYDGTPHSL